MGDGEGRGLSGPGNVTKSFTFRLLMCCPKESGLMMISLLLKDNESVGPVFVGLLCPFSPPMEVAQVSLHAFFRLTGASAVSEAQPTE